MDLNILKFFERLPEAVPLYGAIEEAIISRWPDVTVKVAKTQISFKNKYGFAYVWLPVRKIRGRPDVYIILSFGLSYQLEHPRIIQAVQPYPNRWTHHTLITAPDDVDEVVIGWMKEAYQFSLVK